MVLDSIALFLLDSSLKLIPTRNSFSYTDISNNLNRNLHALVVDAPLLAENITLIVDLASQVITELSETILEFFLKSVEGIVDVAHSISCLLLVFLNFAVQVIKKVRKIVTATYV